MRKLSLFLLSAFFLITIGLFFFATLNKTFAQQAPGWHSTVGIWCPSGNGSKQTGDGFFCPSGQCPENPKYSYYKEPSCIIALPLAGYTANSYQGYASVTGSPKGTCYYRATTSNSVSCGGSGGTTNTPTPTPTPRPTTASTPIPTSSGGGGSSTSVPAAPTTLNATSSCPTTTTSQLFVSWNKVTGATHYIVGAYYYYPKGSTTKKELGPYDLSKSSSCSMATGATNPCSNKTSYTIPIPSEAQGFTINVYVQAVNSAGTSAKKGGAFTAMTCGGGGGGTTTTPVPSTSTAPTTGTCPSGNYAITGWVFDNSATYNGTTGTGLANVSLNITGNIANTIKTGADGTYKLCIDQSNLPSGGINADITVQPKFGYSISPGTPYSQKHIYFDTNKKSAINFGLVTPPSAIQASTGSNSITGGIYVGSTATPFPLVDITIQGGPTCLPSTLTHMVTNAAGKFNFGGLNSCEGAYKLNVIMSTTGQFTFGNTRVNDVEIQGVPIGVAFRSVPAGWASSPVGNTGFSLAQGILYVGSAKTVKIDYILNGTCINNCHKTGDSGYWYIAYPNGGYCLPVPAGSPIANACAGLANNPPGSNPQNTGGTGPGGTTLPDCNATDTVIGQQYPYCTQSDYPSGQCGSVDVTVTCYKTRLQKDGTISDQCKWITDSSRTETQTLTCSAGGTCSNGTCTYPNQPTVTQGVTETPTITITPTIPAGNTSLVFIAGLDGLGSTGDNPNPTNSTGSNKNPLRTLRNFLVEIYNTTNVLVTTKAGSIVYDNASGLFKGTIDMVDLATDSYTVKVRSDGYLRRLVTGVQNITKGQSNTMPQVRLVTGDVNKDNALNILDYNILISCSIYTGDNGQACSGQSEYKTLSDLDDNGVVDQFDYNLFVREYSVQNGE